MVPRLLTWVAMALAACSLKVSNGAESREWTLRRWERDGRQGRQM